MRVVGLLSLARTNTFSESLPSDEHPKTETAISKATADGQFVDLVKLTIGFDNYLRDSLDRITLGSRNQGYCLGRRVTATNEYTLSALGFFRRDGSLSPSA